MLNTDKLSYWEYKSYLKDIDFLIVGAGIVGYSTALHLREKHPDARILIIERGYLPAGASTKNAGFACFGSATELHDDIVNFGEEKVWQTVELRWKGLQRLRSIIGDDGLKLEINGSWDLITEKDKEIFEATKAQIPYFNEKIQKITGETNVYSIDEDVAQKFGFERVVTSFYNRLEGQIDTASMNDVFYKKVIQNDIKVLFGVEYRTYSAIPSGIAIHTSIGDFTANRLVFCTNGFASKHVTDEVIKPARAQVLITNEIESLKVKGTFHYDRGYYYFRNIDGRILFGGGRNLAFEDETTEELENTELIMARLKELMDTVILPHQTYEIDRSWAGIMGVGNTKNPIVKQIDKNVYCGVRLGGMGVAIGSLIGEQLSELIK